MTRMDSLDKERESVQPWDTPPVPTPPTASYEGNDYYGNQGKFTIPGMEETISVIWRKKFQTNARIMLTPSVPTQHDSNRYFVKW